MQNNKPSAGAMAWLVGEALRAGGIAIHQTKEKFGSIRVYVAMPNNHESRRHYREVYLTAMAACPELADNLREGADYSEWLFPTEADLDAYIVRHSAKGGANALGQWDPRFALARKLIRGEDTSDYLDGDTEVEEVSAAPTTVSIDSELFQAAHAAVAWACVQSGGGDWSDVYHQMNDALNNKGKK